MKNFIDPTIDCVFKRILGANGQEKLLLNFLNSILKPPVLLTQIVIQNPYNDKDYLKDKLSIVDIKAKDENGNTYQIEIQIATPSYLANRILHTWSDIYQGQLVEGKGFEKLKPVISIWLLTGTLLKHSAPCHHHFEVYDRHHDVYLSDHMSIHVLELAKWHKPDRLQPEDIWLYFFKEGKYFKDLPPELKQLPLMREAMNVLTVFSDQDEDYQRYKTRLQEMRIRWSDEGVAKEQRQKLAEAAIEVKQAEEKAELAEEKVEQVEAEKEQLRIKTQQAEARAERLEAMMRKSGFKLE